MGKWADESFRARAERSMLEQLGHKRDTPGTRGTWFPMRAW